MSFFRVSFSGGAPHEILRAWYQNRFTLVLSLEIYVEYERTAHELAERFPPIDLNSILDYMKKKAVYYAPLPLSSPVCVDPADDKFIACALASKTRIVVSGDKHLQAVTGYREVQVVTPRQFFDML
jgi:putative PIN family toxin of toxin-antitoxin system